METKTVLLLNHPFVPFEVYTIGLVLFVEGKMSKIKIYVLKRSHCVKNLNVPSRSLSVKALWVT